MSNITKPINTALELFGCYVIDVGVTLGWNTSASTLSVNLVECPEDGKNFTRPTTGTYAFFKINNSFGFAGVVDSWRYEKGIGGRIISVTINDLRVIADMITVFMYPCKQINSVSTIIDAYRYYDSGASGNTSGWVYGAGMSFNKIIDAINNSHVTFNNVSYRIYLSSLPKMSDDYRIKESNMSLLGLIQQAATDGGFEFFINTNVNDGVIRFNGIRRNQIYAGLNLTNWIDARRGSTLVSESEGIENRSMKEATNIVIIGPPKEEMISVTDLKEYWGYLDPDIPTVHLEHLKYPGYNLQDSYEMTESEMYAALAGFDEWLAIICLRRLGDRLYGKSPIATDLKIPDIINYSCINDSNLWKDPTKIFNKLMASMGSFVNRQGLEQDNAYMMFLRSIHEEYRKLASVFGTKFYCTVEEFAALTNPSLLTNYSPKSLSTESFNGYYDDLDRIQKFFYNSSSKKMSGYVIVDDLDDAASVADIKFDSGSYIFCLANEDTNAQEGIDRTAISNAGRMFVKADFTLETNPSISDDPIVVITLTEPITMSDARCFKLLDQWISDTKDDNKGILIDWQTKITKLLGYRDFMKDIAGIVTTFVTFAAPYVIGLRDGGYFGERDIPPSLQLRLSQQDSNRNPGITGAVIPAISIGETYGPWAKGGVYQSGNSILARAGWYGKSIIDQREELAPWNFESEDEMNDAANSIANSMTTTFPENATYSCTIAGLPELSIGTMVNTNSSISDISVSLNTGGILTTYTVQAFTKRFGEDSRSKREQMDRASLDNAILKTENIYYNRAINNRPQRSSKTFLDLVNPHILNMAAGNYGPIVGAAGTLAYVVTNTVFKEVLSADYDQTIIKIKPSVASVIKSGNKYLSKLSKIDSLYSANSDLTEVFAPYSIISDGNGGFGISRRLPSVETPVENETDIINTDYIDYMNDRDVGSDNEDELRNSNGEISDEDAIQPNIEMNSFNANSQKAVGLKAPMWLTGWGYDTDDEPTPTKEEISEYLSTIGEDFYITDEEEWQYRTACVGAWKSGPIDIRWDNDRKVWVASVGLSKHRHLKEDMSKLGGGIAFACYFPYDGYQFLAEE